MALYHAQTKQRVLIPANRPLSDHMKRSVIEKLEPATHKGHSFFRLEARATMK